MTGSSTVTRWPNPSDEPPAGVEAPVHEYLQDHVDLIGGCDDADLAGRDLLHQVGDGEGQRSGSANRIGQRIRPRTDAERDRDRGDPGQQPAGQFHDRLGHAVAHIELGDGGALVEAGSRERVGPRLGSPHTRRLGQITQDGQ